ncbi:carbohydrate ABC transporter permease [Aureibacillus halotolerans]|uniref:Maltose/maltodextrin transport system permease protein n=1 Tax=Aureibacillus halotolerans TaxID=1508390 RepID=A0A4R6U885_9BACI|nr:sugar ABC transporter permease [Aureibacillus halotolerans]TDQ42780.1 carbohydrate ABC transporter membrane protein 1 (CUT1 family) [Aureibacillus halotolerans]
MSPSPKPTVNTPLKEHQNANHNPTIATILSIVFAGLGQLYNRRYFKGGGFIILEMAFLVVFAGFLNDGLWGLRTLGIIPIEHHSVFLLIEGIIALLLLLFFLALHVLNVMDARKNAQRLQMGLSNPTMKQTIRHTWDQGFPYLFVTPGLVMLTFVTILPILFTITLAFTDYSLFNSPPRNLLSWVGFDNFIRFFQVEAWRNTFVSVFSWTLVWTFVATTLQVGLGLLLALLVNDERIRFKRLIRTVLILPWAVPSFVTILIFAALFNGEFGAINRDLLEPIFGAGLPWMMDPFWAKVALILIQTWLGFPFVFALFTGVLQSISRDWYEAADVDGGTRFQKFRFITLPHILFATAPLLIMQYAGNFNNFNIIYLFNDGGPAVPGQTAGGTDILISWVYDLTFTQNQYSMAAAITLVLGLIVTSFAVYQFRKTAAFKEDQR